MDQKGLEIHSMPGHLLRRLHQISVSIFVEQLEAAGFDLTPVQFGALSAIAAHPGIDQATLAGLIAHDRVTIGGVVDRLVHKGLVKRSISQTDRRARCLELTGSGEEVLAAARPLVERVQERILEGLDPGERQGFVTMLGKLADAGNALSRAPLRGN